MTAGSPRKVRGEQEFQMADDLKNRGEPDRSRINMAEPHEVRYWTKELGVTEEQLQQAVKSAGPMVASVRQYLSRQKK